MGGGSRLVEAKFGQGEPRLVGMAAAALGGGGEVRDGEREREPTCSRKRNGGKKREREIFLLSADGRGRRPASRGEIDKDSKHRTRTADGRRALSCRVSAATAAATDAKIDLRISSYDMQPIIRLTTTAALSKQAILTTQRI